MPRTYKELASRYLSFCALTLLSTLSGCSSFALLQTAHTVPPRGVRLASSYVDVSNRYDSRGSEPYRRSLDVAGRVGLTKSLDLGITPFMAMGVAVDAKLNLIAPESAFALAPRLRSGGGFAEPGWAALAESGLITSYWFFERIEPYAAIGYANYWVRYEDHERPVHLEPGERLASRRGYGDGLLQATAGVDVALVAGFGIVGELRYFVPMQNDPGDGYRFVDNRILALGLRYQSR